MFETLTTPTEAARDSGLFQFRLNCVYRKTAVPNGLVGLRAVVAIDYRGR
jgi:hypothetical protein